MNSKFTSKLEFEKPSEKTAMPTYRVLDQEGVVVDKSAEIDISNEEAIKLYKDMLTGSRNTAPNAIVRSLISDYS